MSKRYLIRTHGCQMNEHDSERIAGLFEADGMVPADGIDDADVVVLNTCCIRENADNKLYGTLGHLKSVKAARPELEIVVGGCLAQKDRDLIQEKAGHVDVVFGTHNVHRAVDLLDPWRRRSDLDRDLFADLERQAGNFPRATNHRERARRPWSNAGRAFLVFARPRYHGRACHGACDGARGVPTATATGTRRRT